jgi:pimeloyl-ACP methyl ester carboxylesterase
MDFKDKIGSLESSSFRHFTATLGDYEIHYVLENAHRAPLFRAQAKTLVLVHGWPDLWYGYRKLIRPLSLQGFKYTSFFAAFSSLILIIY